jgi:hypothetical protein
MATPEATTDPSAPKPSHGLRPVLATVAALGSIGVVVAFVLSGSGSALGVAAGGGLAVANLWAFGRLGSGLVSATGAKAPWIAMALGKLLVLFGLVVLLLSEGLVGPIQLSLGYLALPVGIALSHVSFPCSKTRSKPRIGLV